MPFPITCAACHKTFSIADDVYERKVKGRVVTIKCKQCHAGIRVDGTKDTPVFSLTDSVRPPPAAAVAPQPESALAAVQAEAETPPPAPATEREQPKPAAAPTAAASKAAPAPAAPKPTTAAVAPKAAPAATRLAPAVATPKTAPTAVAPKAAAVASKAAPAAVAPKAAPAAAKGPLATTTAAKATITTAGRVPDGAAKAQAPTATAQLGVTPKAPTVTAVADPTAAKAAPPPEGSPVAAASEALWAVDYPDGEDREFTLLQIEKELASGAINPSTLVWREGMAEWLEIGQVPELRALTLPKAPAPLAAQRPQAASAPALPEPRAKAASAPALPEPRAKAASAPALPELSATLPQPNGPQRLLAPSASELEQPRKGLTPPPAPFPKPPAPASLEARAAESAFAQPITALTPQAFPAPQSPFAAAPFPAQPSAPLPFARPSPTPFGAVAPIGDVAEWPKKSRAPLIIGGVALLAVAALVFVLTRSSGDEVPPPAPITALPAAAPTTPAAPRAAEAAPGADTASTSDQRPSANSAIEAPSGAPQATPNAGFAELFASGARTADEKHGVTGPTQRFDANAAKAALATAATHTPPCREKGGPTGKATVVVTFDPSGKVSSATVSDPPFAGTSSGACIAAALKRATVPAFSGLPGTVTKIISIQ